MTVKDPGVLLAFFAAVFRPPAPTAFGKLTRVLLPFATSIIRTLANAASTVVLSTQISHDNPCPMTHVRGMVAHCELLNQGEDVEIIRQQVFLFFGVEARIIRPGGRRLVRDLRRLAGFQLGIDFQLGDQMRVLEIRPESTVFRDVCQQLQRQQHILISWHCSLDTRRRRVVKQVPGV